MPRKWLRGKQWGKQIGDPAEPLHEEADIRAAPEIGGAIRSRRRLGLLVVALP